MLPLFLALSLISPAGVDAWAYHAGVLTMRERSAQSSRIDISFEKEFEAKAARGGCVHALRKVVALTRLRRESRMHNTNEEKVYTYFPD